MSIEHRNIMSQDRIERIEDDISMLKDISEKQRETIYGLSIGFERINLTIGRIIDMQDEHAKRLQDIAAITVLSRHWKFFTSITLIIIIVSLAIHSSLKEFLGWVT